MTRRERHIRIIDSFPSQDRRFHQNQLLARLDLAALTDEAVETLASTMVSSFKWQQRENAKQRARRASNA